ncbi:Hypothetical predicted protein [Paramuricea clavata]|uniref:Uncharacterized protein n=1 Tax=Paramuricea clavata TaxID=317549 RepID=A0A6S7IPQ8_PARCT|nr:Hypothetical predicted protein [Paramuricea clavata]
MMQASNANYSTLKNTVLEMWEPAAIGVHRAPDLLVKYFEKHFRRFFNMINIPYESSRIHNSIEYVCEDICKRHIFKTDFHSYFHAQPPFQLREAILTGSLSEGLYLFSSEPPDMDFMCVLKNIMFSQEDQEDGSLLLREDTPFVYAFITRKENKNLWSEFLDEGDKHTGKLRLSSRKLKEELEKNYKKTGGLFRTFGKEGLEEVDEGAAVTIRKPEPVVPSVERYRKFKEEILRQPWRVLLDNAVSDEILHAMLDKLIPSSDIVLSISCEGWPYCAREWITRERVWPDKHSVETITLAGFHIVPKSSHDGDFRLSFSCAETILVKTLEPLQHKVMRAFKAVIKHHQRIWSPSAKGIISSYHLKTIAFWHFEKTSQESWTEETVVHHLVVLLEELAEALRIQSLPMYFMPKVNLLQDVDDPEVTLDLMDKISRLSHNFPAMSEAVNDKTTLKESAILIDSDHNVIHSNHDDVN